MSALSGSAGFNSILIIMHNIAILLSAIQHWMSVKRVCMYVQDFNKKEFSTRSIIAHQVQSCIEHRHPTLSKLSVVLGIAACLIGGIGLVRICALFFPQSTSLSLTICLYAGSFLFGLLGAAIGRVLFLYLVHQELIAITKKYCNSDELQATSNCH